MPRTGLSILGAKTPLRQESSLYSVGTRVAPVSLLGDCLAWTHFQVRSEPFSQHRGPICRQKCPLNKWTKPAWQNNVTQHKWKLEQSVKGRGLCVGWQGRGAAFAPASLLLHPFLNFSTSSLRQLLSYNRSLRSDVLGCRKGDVTLLLPDHWSCGSISEGS